MSREFFYTYIIKRIDFVPKLLYTHVRVKRTDGVRSQPKEGPMRNRTRNRSGSDRRLAAALPKGDRTRRIESGTLKLVSAPRRRRSELLAKTQKGGWNPQPRERYHMTAKG